MKGGYQLVDLQGKNLTSEPVNIPGIYEIIESNVHWRALRVCNVIVNGVERPDGYCTLSVDGSDFMLLYGNPSKYIKVTEDDMVSLTNF